MAESVAAEESKVKVERVVWVAVIFCTVSVPFIMTVIVHIDDCPHQPFIPITILMAGLSMSLSNIINAADKYSPPKQSNYKRRKRLVSALNLLTNCFTTACFVAGAIWVYGKGKPSKKKSSGDYCNPSLYEFAFWLFNVSIVFIALVIVIILIAFIIKSIRKL